MSWWLKLAAAVGSGVPDPMGQAGSTNPVPQIGVENKPAPGQRGPHGLSGRTTYSRVNVGTPPTPDAGASSQKSQPPRGLESLKTAQLETNMNTNYMRQPSLNDLVKVAMEGSAAKIDLSLEAARQLASAGHQPPRQQEKTASAGNSAESVPTNLIDKLASGMFYLAKEMNPKLADVNFPGTENNMGPGKGPNASGVMAATEEGDGVMEAGQSGKATPKNQPPVNPPTQKDPTRVADPGNGLATNDSMMHGEQPVEPISNEKTTLTNENVKASAAYLNNLIACGLAKVAADEQGQLKVAVVGMAVPAAMGAAQAPSGHRLRGAVSGTAGTALGQTAGVLGGGALGAGAGAVGGGLLGAGLGALAGGPGGAALGAGLGAGGGALLGGAAGGIGGGIYGRQKGYQAAMAPYKEIKQLRAAQAAPEQEVTASVQKVALMGGLAGAGGQAAAAGGGSPGLAERVGLSQRGRTWGQAITDRLPGGQTRNMNRIISGQQQAQAQKMASVYARNLMSVGLYKQAEDAIFPAQISAGKADAVGATPPRGAAPSEEGVPKEPGDVSSQKRKMVDSNEAAINYTKRDAKADPKSDMRDVVTEPALSSATDKVLSQALDNDGGNKISSVQMAAARALVSKLAAGVPMPAAGKKTKKAMGGSMGGSMGMGAAMPPSATGAQAANT